MEAKWFLVIIGIIFTSALIIGIYFIALNISTQSYKQFQESQNQSDARFDNSTLVHDFLFDNITDLKNRLDPLLDQIPNATEQKQRQDLHYNQSFQQHEEWVQLMALKQSDHELIIDINKSLDKIINGLDIQNPVVINNGTPVPLTNATIVE